MRLPNFDYREHYPYHVIVCARPDTRPFTDPDVANMVCESLCRMCEKCGAYVGAYCLMPDHLHMLISPDRSGITLGSLVGRIKGVTTNASWKLGWSGRLWQARFFDHIVRKSEGIADVAQYIFQNPDRKGMAEDYPHRFVDPDLR